jgi:hypothetical protein
MRVTQSFKVGDRVRVTIQDPSQYAYGCAKCLDGALGTVETVKDTSSCGRYLVCFDEARPSWWSNGSPTKTFHFPAKDLTATS